MAAHSLNTTAPLSPPLTHSLSPLSADTSYNGFHLHHSNTGEGEQKKHTNSFESKIEALFKKAPRLRNDCQFSPFFSLQPADPSTNSNTMLRAWKPGERDCRVWGAWKASSLMEKQACCRGGVRGYTIQRKPPLIPNHEKMYWQQRPLMLHGSRKLCWQ